MSNKRKFCWVFDLDDTLMWTSYAYSIAFRKFYDYMLRLFRYRLIELRTLGTISEKIDLELRTKINPTLGVPYGYSRYRFPESLVQTYRWLCDRDFGRFNELVASRIRDIGYQAFDPLLYQEQGLVEGGKETLDFLQMREDRLILITKGDELVQKTKIEILELDKWFGKEIHIVNSKTQEDFRGIQQHFPEEVVISVGNSFKSDIEPALRAGLHGLYIPYYTWAAEPETEFRGSDSRVFKIDRIFKFFYLVETNELFKTPG